MIREACSCGATLEYTPSGYSPAKEADVAKEWRENHKHESQTVARDVPRVSNEETNKPLSNLVGTSLYTLGEDYIYNGEGEPVWISNIHNPPPFWWQSVPKQPMDVRPAEYDSPA